MPWIVNSLIAIALMSITTNVLHKGVVRRQAEAAFQVREQERLRRLLALYRQHRHRMDPDALARVAAELRRAGVID
jgi:hypothetical protein